MVLLFHCSETGSVIIMSFTAVKSA